MNFIKPNKTSKLFEGILWLVFLCFISSCRRGDPILANAQGQKLYLSEVKGLIPPNSTPEDSLSILNGYIDQWVRERLFYKIARKKLSDKASVDKQLRESEIALSNFAYEQQLVRESVDTNKTKAQLNEYFTSNPDQFTLIEPIVQCDFIKVKRTEVNGEPLSKWMDSNSEKEQSLLVEFCKAHATLFTLNDSTWYTAGQVQNLIPNKSIDKAALGSNKRLSITDDNFYYIIKITKRFEAGDQAPFEYAKSRITILLNQKERMEFLSKYKNNMVSKAAADNDYKLYTKRIPTTSPNTKNK